MKLAESELKQIIQEEIDLAVEEGRWTQARARGKSMGSRAAAWGSEKVGKGFGKIGATDTAAKFAGGAEELRTVAKGKESLHLMNVHVKKIQAAMGNLMDDAGKLGLKNEPTMKKAVEAMTRASKWLDRIVADRQNQGLDAPAAATMSTGQPMPGAEEE